MATSIAPSSGCAAACGVPVAEPTTFSIDEFPVGTVTRFRQRVDHDGPVHPILGTACHMWTGTRIPKRGADYGTLWCRRVNVRAHRLAWMIERGAIPRALFVLHRCDNPPCVNVEHLFLGTHDENMRDKQIKGRAALVLTDSDVIAIREATGERAADVGARYGVTGEMVNLIRRGEKWDHVGGPRTFAGRRPPPPVFKAKLTVEDTRDAILAMLPPEDRGGTRRHPEKPYRWQALERLASRLGVSKSMVHLTYREGATVDLMERWRAILGTAT